jgi:hypothetical protein
MPRQARKANTMSETLTLGNTPITVADETFAEAFQIGYLRFKLDYCNKPLSGMDIYALYVGTITSVQHSGRYGAGWLTGWIAALLERSPQRTPPAPLPIVPTLVPSSHSLADVEVTV